VVIWQHCKRVLGIFSPRMCRNSYLGTSGQKSDPPFAPATSISITQTHFHYRVTFTGYIRCFLLLRRMTIWTLTFDLLTLKVCCVQRFSCSTHIPFFIILWLSVTELRVLNIWSHFRYLKQSLRMRRVTWPLTRGKIVHIFEIPDPNLPIHFVTFRALRRRLSHVIGKK